MADRYDAFIRIRMPPMSSSHRGSQPACNGSPNPGTGHEPCGSSETTTPSPPTPTSGPPSLKPSTNPNGSSSSSLPKPPNPNGSPDARAIAQEIDLNVDVTGGLAGVEYLDAITLLVLPNRGDAVLLTLDSDQLMNIASVRAQRTFSPEECASWGIEPCPETIEALRSRYAGAGA